MNRKLIVSLVVFTSLIFAGCSQSIATTKPVNSTSSSSSNTEYYFTRENKGNPEEHLIQVIDSSKNSLDIAIYSLTDRAIANAIIQAKKRNVKVEIITDKKEAASKSEKIILTLLKSNNIPIKINTHSGLMHMKVTVMDGSIVTTGSYNYTSAASKINDENLVIIHDSKIAKAFDDEFTVMWNDNNSFENIN